MIGSVFRTGFLTLIGLVLAWATFLLFPSFSNQILSSEQASFATAFPIDDEPGTTGRRWSEDGLPVQVARHVLGDSTTFPSAALIVNRRLGVALRFAPLVLVAFGSALVAGLLLRERLRVGSSYASPSVSFLAKRMSECVLLVCFVWSLSPVPLPYWGFYPLLVGLMMGTTTYVANLPLRL